MNIVAAREIAARHGADKLVLVASRRTDLPRFHAAELCAGLQAGVLHPQGPRQAVWELRFEPRDIHSVGLWSQDFSAWLPLRQKLTGYRFWYRFTILPDDPVCKPQAPPVKVQLQQLARLVELDSPQAVQLCCDPLVRYRRRGEARWRHSFSKARLEPIFSAAARLGLSAVTTSIIDRYRKAERRFERLGLEVFFPDRTCEADRRQLARMIRRFTATAGEHGLTVQGCCEQHLQAAGLTRAAHCVDGTLLSRLFGPGASTRPDPGQRRKYGCGCTRALDVGRYADSGQWSHRCGHDCPQCYARP